MADISDPIMQALAARLAAGPTISDVGTPRGDAQLQQNTAAVSASADTATAAANAPAVPGAGPEATFYAYNPQTNQLIVNGEKVPTDYRLWSQAATLSPAQLRPMSVARLSEDGYIPLTQDHLQQFLQQTDQNAQSHFFGDVGHNIWSGVRDVVGGAAREIPRVLSTMPEMQVGALGADALGNAVGINTGKFGGVMQGSQDLGRGISDAMMQANQASDAERRASQTLAQQAYSDATFGTHPGRAFGNLVSNQLARSVPGIAAFAFNPAVGAGAMGAQGAQAGAETAGERFDAATAGLSPEQFTAANPMYAQLRGQGLSDTQARLAMRQHAQDMAGDVTGVLGVALAPLAGRIPLAAIGRMTALAPAMGGEGLGGFLARRLAMGAVTSAENTAIGAAQNIPGQVAGDVASGRGVQGVGDYTHGLGDMALLGAAMGGITRAPARVTASDFGAALGAIPGKPVSEANPAPAGMPGMPLPPTQGPAPAAMPNVPGSPARPLPQVGEVGDMLGGPARAPAVPTPEPAAPAQAPVANPGQAEIPGVPPVGPQLPTPKPGLIAQRAAEQAAARAAPPSSAPAGALPPPGFTEGQRGMLESSQQSLQLVQNLLDSNQFNKRTKSGKAAIAQLVAERDRLQALVDQHQNAQLGEAMGAAREAAAQQQQAPASFVEDASGQRGLPGVEPVSAPDGAPPGNSEPPPIGQDQPMSVQEAQARLAAQRARNPDRQPPQPDLFPRQLKAGLQDYIDKSRQGVTPSTPEPAVDLAAQMAALKNGTRDAVFVAAGNEGQAPKVAGKAVRAIKRPEGTLYTTNPAKAKAYREAPALNDDLLAKLQDLPQTKADAVQNGDRTVTQALDANGAVVKEALGQGNAAAVAAAAPSDGGVRQLSAEEAQARRASLNQRFDAGEQLSPEELHQLVQETRSQRDTGAPGQQPLEGMLNGTAGPRAAAEAAHKGFLHTDLNGLKAINDAAGHAAGDTLLHAFGKLYRDVAQRHGGIPWIAGGDEFVSSYPTRAAAQKAHAELQALAKKHVVAFEANDGTIHRIEGVGFAGGVGKNVREADAASEAAKRAHYASTGTERRGASQDRRAQEPQPAADRGSDAVRGSGAGKRARVPESAPGEVKPTRSAALKAKTAAKRAEAEDAARVEAAVGKKKVSSEELTGSARAAPADVNAAVDTLRKDVEANHPKFLDAFAEEHAGPGRQPESPLLSVPLTERELGVVGDRLQATALDEHQQQAAGTWSPAKSVVARLLDAAGMPQEGAKLRAAVKSIAEATPKQLQAFMHMVSGRLSDSTLAKGIARGMDNVRAAAKDAPVREMAVGTKTEKAAKAPEKNDTYSGGRVTMYGHDVPAAAGRAVREWVRTFEKTAGQFLPDELHVMSPAEASARYGRDFGTEGFAGKVKNPETGADEHVVAVDWKALGDGPAAVETLAHEFAHTAMDHVFERLPAADKTAVRRAYDDWLKAQGRGTPTETLLNRLPPALADLARANHATPEQAYAGSWHEWLADEVAKWMLTDSRPRTAVERFFSHLADAFRKLYAAVTGRGRPSDAVATMMDNLVERSQNLRQQDAVARANAMNYGREPAEPASAPEQARQKITVRAMQAKTDRVVQGAKDLGSDVGKMFGGDTHAVFDRLNRTWSHLAEGKGGDLMRNIMHGLMSMRDIVDRYRNRGGFGQGLVDWDNAMRMAEKHSREVQQAANIASEQAHRLSAPVRTALNKLMYKATTYGIHPDEAFGTGKNTHLADTNATVEGNNRARYAEVRQLWDQMRNVPGDPQRVFAQLRDALAQIHRETFTARHANIDRLQLSQDAKTEMHNLLSEQEARMVKGPYFPLTRQGNYITSVTMPAQRVGEYPTMAEARRVAGEQRSLNPHAEVTISKTPDDTWDVHVGEKAVYFHPTLRDAKNAQADILREVKEAWSHMGVDFDTAEKELGRSMVEGPFHTQDFFRKMEVPSLNKFTHELNDLYTQGKIDPEVYKTFSEMVIEALPETSTRKSGLTRQNIRGADQDMLGGYVRHVASSAHSYGKTKMARDINDAWAAMAKHSRAEPELNTVMNSLRSRQEIQAKRMERNWTNTTANTLQDMSSMMSLGLSPAFMVQQALQPVVVTLPVLAARAMEGGKSVGYGHAMEYLKKAYEGAVPFFSKRGGEQFMAEARRMLGTYAGEGKTLQESANDMISTFGKTADEREMLNYMHDRGTLDFAFLNAVADAASSSKFGDKTKAALRIAMALPQQIEAMNRMTSGLAAYRIARELRGFDHADAMREADTVVAQTHGDYARYNRPSVFNRPLVGMALQFKMYTQFIYSLLIRNFANMMDRSLSKEERLQATRTLGYVIGSHATFGGITGIGPIAAAAKFGLGGLMYAAAGAGLIDQKKRDQTIGDWISANFNDWADQELGAGAGKYLSRIAMYGLPAVADMNIANKIGIPDLTDMRFTGGRQSDKPSDTMNQIIQTALGPVYANAQRVADGTQQLLKGNVGQAGRMLLPAAPRALVNAIVEQQDGVVTSSGNVVRPAADISPYRTFLRALGLQDATTSQIYDERAARYAAKDRIVNERTELLQAYSQAKGGDRAAVAQQIADFNRGRPAQFQISAATMQRQLQRKPESPTDKAAARAIGQH